MKKIFLEIPRNKLNILMIKMISSFILLIALCFVRGNIYAENSDFSVAPKIPSNQMGENKGFFNLQIEPGSSQEVSIILNNSSSDPISVDADFARATTNNNGLAIYDSTDNLKDSSLKYNIEDYVEIPDKEITIAPHSQKLFKSKIQMPDEKFDGVLAGGFSFKKKDTDSSQKSSQGVAVTNEYRYVIALVIQQNSNKITPQLNLNEVEASQVNSRNVISANIQNTTPTYIKNMNVSATVQAIDVPDNKFTFNNTEMKMAPNSNFNLAIPVSIQGRLGNQTSKELEPGKYHMSMTIYSEKSEQGIYQTKLDGETIHYNYKWNFEKDFEISEKKADELNRNDPTVAYKKRINWLLIIGVLLILIVLLLLLLIFITNHKKNKYQQGE